MPGNQSPSLHEAESTARAARKPARAATAADPGLHPLIHLQASIGNAALSRMLVQRQEEEDEEEVQTKRDPALAQRQGMPEDDEEQVQAKHDDGATSTVIGPEGGALDAGTSGQIEARRGTGSTLPDSTRANMESAFGADFSQVHLHQDSASDTLTRGMSARAFTTGSDIFLRQDVSPGDTEVLAHELTHVVQQNSGTAGPASGEGLTVGAADDAREAEADRAAQAVTAGARLPEDLGTNHQAS